jgi:hypothetical protein
MQEVAGTAISTIAERVKGGRWQGPHFTCIETKKISKKTKKKQKQQPKAVRLEKMEIPVRHHGAMTDFGEHEGNRKFLWWPSEGKGRVSWIGC